MQAEVLATLVHRRPVLRRAWETLLRTERASTPMANPDTLVYLMDWTLDEVFAALRAGARPKGAASARSACACGLNPMLVYFSAMRQVLIEALVLAQAARPEDPPPQREADLAQLTGVVDEAAAREIAAFCSLCLRRGSGGSGAVDTLAVDGRRLASDAAENAVELRE